MSATTRPALSPRLSADEFARWYWRKDELLPFCRQLGLRTGGSKPEVAARILAHLAGSPPAPVVARPRTGPMPTTFSLDTTIGPGWRCNPALGAFLRGECGAGFRFNLAVRTFIHTAVGHSLRDAVACYRASVAPGAPAQPMLPQNEYNAHMRAYFRANPGATASAARAAWHARRQHRAS